MATHYSRYSVARARSAFRLAARLACTLLGTAGLVGGALLPWTGDTPGTDLGVRAFFDTAFEPSGTFTGTIGFVCVVLGLVALLGLVNPTGWLTRLAGVLGVAAFVLFAVQVYRSSGHDIGPGAWLALGGAATAVVGGHFGRYFPVITRIVAPPRTRLR